MSQKISGKNLHYDQTLPPFLARLRGQAAGNSDGPDPRLVRNRRHAKTRSASEDAEDAPIILDEAGNALTGLRLGVDGLVTETEEKKDVEGDEKNEASAEEQEKQKEKTAGIGAGKKRKAGKVIGADDDADERDEEKETKEKPKIQTKKAKSKKVKLSFGDDEG